MFFVILCQKGHFLETQSCGKHCPGSVAYWSSRPPPKEKTVGSKWLQVLLLVW
jgi:hypothetical protein